MHNYFINLLSKEVFYLSGKSPKGQYILFDRDNKIVMLDNLDSFKRAPSNCTGFGWVPPVPTKKLEIKYGGPVFTREVGSRIIHCDKIDCGLDIFENLSELINSWSLEVTEENKNLTIQPSNFLVVFCGSKYNVSKKQISEFLSDGDNNI